MECLNSIIQQDFQNFEVVIGNDYQKQMLTEDSLCICDPRIKIVNHPINLGPIANANALIEMSSGRYFTLLADDDMQTKHFLDVMHDLLGKCGYPPCIFSSFTSDLQVANDSDIQKNKIIEQSKTFTGRQFLNLYLSRIVRTIGCYGVFEINYLKNIGGMKQLGTGRSMYGEMPLVIASGLLQQVVYVNHPLVFFRSHPGSLSNGSTDPEAYASSQEELLEDCLHFLQSAHLYADFHENLFLLLQWFINDFLEVMRRSGSMDYKQVCDYLMVLKKYVIHLKGSPYYWRTIDLLIKILLKEILTRSKAKIRDNHLLSKKTRSVSGT